jgi:hypothetical protein
VKPDSESLIRKARESLEAARLLHELNETEESWKKLEKGEYDWAHLAYTLWPDRVREVCKHDRSIAIAHGLEELCEVEVPAAKKRRKKKSEVQGEF